MTDIRAYRVNRGTGVSKGAFADVLATARGALSVNTLDALVERWTADGRVFQSATPAMGTPETMSAAGTAFTLTAPALHMTIPSGLTVVPIMIKVAGASVTVKRNLFAVMTGDTDSFTSGGEAMQAARNMLTESATAYRTTSVTNLVHSDTAIVEAALTRPRVLTTAIQNPVNLEANFEYNILKGDPFTVVTGPGVLVAYVVQETTAMEATWTMTWAELDTAEYSA